MSTARLVPETWELTGDDAWHTLKQCGRRKLLRESFQRLRVADGFSHARSLAFMISLAAIQGMIALVGVASAFGNSAFADVVVRAVHGAAPGPVGNLLTVAIAQAQKEGATHSFSGLVFGTLGWLITATTAMGQLERGLNRIYGVEKDRAAVQKYGFALLMAISAGALLTLAVGLLAFGRHLSAAGGATGAVRFWDLATWPLGVAIMTVAIAALFRWCPRRRQPAWSWLAYGSWVTVVLWFTATFGLSFYLTHSAGFGQTYGALAGVVALLLWALFSAISVFFGAAIAAQLEAVRSSAKTNPQDNQKVADSEPDAA